MHTTHLQKCPFFACKMRKRASCRKLNDTNSKQICLRCNCTKRHYKSAVESRQASRHCACPSHPVFSAGDSAEPSPNKAENWDSQRMALKRRGCTPVCLHVCLACRHLHHCNALHLTIAASQCADGSLATCPAQRKAKRTHNLESWIPNLWINSWPTRWRRLHHAASSSVSCRRKRATLAKMRADHESKLARCALVVFHVCAHHKAEVHNICAASSARQRMASHGASKIDLHCSNLRVAAVIL